MFGPVAKIVTFNKNSEFQGVFQYLDLLSSMSALNVSYNNVAFTLLLVSTEFNNLLPDFFTR